MIRIARLFANPVDAAALAAGGFCLIAAAAGQGGRFSARLDILNHFAPIWLLGAALAGLYGVILAAPGARPILAGVGLVGILASGALILPELIRPIRPTVGDDAPGQIKLIQFNAWDRNADVTATADWIAAQKPDLVLMQEVEAPIRQAMIQRGFNLMRGMGRSAIFSRLQPVPGHYQIPHPDWKRLPSFSRAEFAGPGGDFSVFSVHIGWPVWRGQTVELSTLAEVLDHYPRDRILLTGDFNLTPWSFTLRRLDERLGLERRDRALFSWPSRLAPTGRLTWPAAMLPIDHIYAGRAWRTVSLTCGPRLGSDHYPLVIRLALVN
ncbi:MAG TPA: endonuclease/exonuclease/phosphatase family protein [Caulobacteraceae bacterium]|jgi:endonuclease/exonuclease/phosphatase (EEP) superfamily protein YafD|nr:endonuclease/exonuclease/phosphatase family protein [Caulobacteraceae bacterium]